MLAENARTDSNNTTYGATVIISNTTYGAVAIRGIQPTDLLACSNRM